MTYTIDRALADRKLLGAALGDPSTWRVWLCVLKAAFGIKLDATELKVLGEIAGGRAPPAKRVRELWAIAGRRSGKSRISAAISVFLACFYPHKLAPGEKGMVLTLSASTEQSRVVFAYALAFLQQSPVLRREIVDTTRSEIRLRNGVVIGMHANTYTTVRGRTLLACVFDEASYWRNEASAQPDTEVYTAILPSLLRSGGSGMLIGISSPYRKVGLLYQKHRQHFGVDGDDVLVVQGGTSLFNPSLTEEMIAPQRAADPVAGRSEWDAEFRSDLVGFLDDASIDRAVDHDRPLELPPRDGVRYAAFVDPSGGASGGNAYTLCIAHREGERVVVDGVWGRRGPFDPKNVTLEYAALCKCYGVNTVTGDRYGAEWVTSAWAESGIRYANSELTASELYLEAQPLFTRGVVSLPDHPQLTRELRLLERTPGRMGKEQVSHPRGVHDDLANATCACMALLVRGPGAVVVSHDLLRRIQSMPRRREMGSGRSPRLMFGISNDPPIEQQGYGPNHLRHLKV